MRPAPVPLPVAGQSERRWGPIAAIALVAMAVVLFLTQTGDPRAGEHSGEMLEASPSALPLPQPSEPVPVPDPMPVPVPDPVPVPGPVPVPPGDEALPHRPLSPNAHADLAHRLASLAEEALQQLQAAPPACLPAVCSRAPGFRPEDGSGGTRKLALVSVPGSGNTWVRALLRGGTRLFTGSMYHDGHLAAGGFEGETLDAANASTAVVKSHHPFHYGAEPWAWADGALHVVRSPVDALTAECNRELAGGHAGVAGMRRMRRRCAAYCWKKLGRLAKMFGIWEFTPKRPVADWDGEGGLRLHFVTSRGGMPVATVFYEDLSRDFVRTAAHVLAFVKLFFADDTALPSVRDSLLCVLHDAQRRSSSSGGSGSAGTGPSAGGTGAEPGAEHRQRHASSAELQLFTNASRSADSAEGVAAGSGSHFDGLSDLGRAVCGKAKRLHFWNAHKWGPCDGRFQFERDDLGPPAPTLVVPSNVCAPP